MYNLSLMLWFVEIFYKGISMINIGFTGTREKINKTKFVKKILKPEFLHFYNKGEFDNQIIRPNRNSYISTNQNNISTTLNILRLISMF